MLLMTLFTETAAMTPFTAETAMTFCKAEPVCDVLDGGLGHDVYVWNLGDGFDEIRDNGENTVSSVPEIALRSLSYVRSGTDFAGVC